MNTVIVKSSRFNAHYPVDIPKNTVNAEAVLIRLDSEWDNLTVRIHWLNVASGVEKVVLLERDQPNTIPWEVLTDLGELRMGLDGMDGGTIVKPTVWLTYGYVVDGVDPESGADPQPPTPSWEQQMVEQATQANQAAQDAKEYAQQVAESIENAGPYAEEAKKAAEAAKASETAAKGAADTATQQATKAQEAVTSIGNAVDQAKSAATAAGSAQRAAETAQTAAAQSAGTAQGAATTSSQAAQTARGAATQAGQYLATVEADAQAAANAATAAGESQEAAQTAAQEAASARDQANTAATTAQSHATEASTAKTAAEQAASNASTAQAGAAQSAQEAAGSASDAQAAKEAAEAAASILPAPTPEDAGKGLRVNTDGTGYEFGSSGGGELLLAEYTHQGNQEIHFTSFDWETGIGECTEPHGLTEAKKVLLVPNEWWTGSDFIGKGITSIPIEWIIYTGANIYAVPTDETHVKITGSDKETIIQVDIGDVSNTLIDATKFHVELPIGFSIKELPVDCTSIRVFAFGITGTLSFRYISLYTNRTYSARIWPEGFLTPPATGLSKAKYALVFWYDICAEAVPAGAVFVMNNLYKAQRKGYSYWVGDRTAEYLVTNCGSGSDNRAEIFTGLLIENRDACYANHTVFRIYAKAVKQE